MLMSLEQEGSRLAAEGGPEDAGGAVERESDRACCTTPKKTRSGSSNLFIIRVISDFDFTSQVLPPSLNPLPNSLFRVKVKLHQ